MKKYILTYLSVLFLLASIVHASFSQTNCNKPSPPNTNDVRPLTIDWVWQNRLKEGVLRFHNFMMDQIFANGGYLNYIVRWE